ncbi:uncharacterized protein LOC114828620 [Galendromus occidentalis]|uniref:Uncharacterized protein LOC114828620 n=1 Tax=Galendromus occidentalis TaxID=34638 RepID=A0AAJ7SI65_9ACAR|nr:uncharacterized protein LOC114828620 [Galendromus occidentalis]
MAVFRENGDGVEKFDVADWYNVLGMQYNPGTDSMKLKVPAQGAIPEIVTKRSVLSAIASIFDRMGIAAPLLVHAKLLMQKMWSLNLAWDDPVPQEVERDFKTWSKELKYLDSIVIPRSYWQHDTQDSRVLHVFSDASRYAYGFCAYIVSRSAQGCTSSFLLAKSRVAPLKNATIPRLELMAMTLAAEAIDYIRTHCGIAFDEQHVWTDNSGVYFQVTSEQPEKLATFARSRVLKIKRLTNGTEIHHVPGELNPADLVSRGCTFKEFSESIWLTGPKFITEPAHNWPRLAKQKHLVIDAHMVGIEETPFKSFIVTRPEPPIQVSVNLIDKPTAERPPAVILRFDTCSRWSIYLRAIVRFRRAIDHWRHRITKRELTMPILQAELTRAEEFIVSQVQAECYGNEYRCLLTDSGLPRKSTLRVFNPFLKDNLIALGGRLGDHLGDLPKNPIILPPKHPVTKMILRYIHERSCHAGPRLVLMTARQKYWVPQGRRLIQNLIHGCKNCRVFHAKPVSTPMGPPPDVRVTKSHPFEHVGTDVIGPLFINEAKEQKKIWIIIFTCCAMRAIHLEILNSLSTTEFMMSLRRFKARRGCPRTFYSDNAKAFKRAAEDLKVLGEIMQGTTVREALARDGIEWKFSIEKSPWQMGFTERLVGSVKSALRRVLGKAVVNAQEMATVLCEVELMVNKRPLCEVPDAEHIDVLTPLHFLVIRTEDPTQDSAVPAKLKSSDVLKRWRHKKTIVESLWKRWEHEYLLLLRNFHETSPRDLQTLKVGQVVIIKDTQTPKLCWKIGRVEKLNISRDNIVRSCMLRMGNGKNLQRPLSLLYPLEIE